jgi:hypothetical protein
MTEGGKCMLRLMLDVVFPKCLPRGTSCPLPLLRPNRVLGMTEVVVGWMGQIRFTLSEGLGPNCILSGQYNNRGL